jgi:anti-anti-sigma regulatory factor
MARYGHPYIPDLQVISCNLATDMVSAVWQASCQQHRRGKPAVLRITTCIDSGATRLVVEGRLAGACVGELERCWRETVYQESLESIVVDLSSVTFIDASGKQLLTHMHEQGIRLVASGLLVKSLIEEIERSGA